MCKKFVSVLLVLCLLLSTIGISAFADEVDVGWTDAKREEFMERVYAGDVGVSDLKVIMGQDEDLDNLLLNYIDSVGVSVDDNVCDNDVSVQSLIDDDFNIIPDPYDSEYDDDRVLLQNVCKVYLWFDNSVKSTFVCSGCLVGDNKFLTAAHCIYLDHDEKVSGVPDKTFFKGSMAVNVLVVPMPTFIGAGSSPASWSSGSGWCDMSSLIMDEHWKDSDGAEKDVNYDWALFSIDSVDGNWQNTHVKGVRSISEMPDVCPIGKFGMIAGYPAIGFEGDPGRTSGSLTVCNGVVEKCFHSSGYYDVYHIPVPSAGGMSGCPVFDFQGYVVGVLHGSLNNNEGCAVFCRFDDSLAACINRYIM